jgi:hypothetical protein
MGRAAESRAGDDTGALEAGEAEALETLRLAWGNSWEIGHPGIRWRATRRDGTGHVLTRASADGLALALRISRGRQR